MAIGDVMVWWDKIWIDGGGEWDEEPVTSSSSYWGGRDGAEEW